MDLDSKIVSVEVKTIGKCSNCNKETCYYDTVNNQYVCSEVCYIVLNTIYKSFERRVGFGKDVRNAMKFLGECMLLLPKEVIAYLKDKGNK